MYNNWQLQQIAAMQLELLQNRLMVQNFMPQQAQLPPSRQVNLVSDDDDDSVSEDDEDERSLYVGNLHEKVTEDLLYEVFLQAGPIEKAHIAKDNTGRFRNFGFVTYVHRCSAHYAIKLYLGLNLYRKTLNIKFQGRLPPRPSDVEAYHNRRSGSSNNNSSSSNSFDNTKIRVSRVSSASPPASKQNPFKRDEMNEKPALSTHSSAKHASSYMRPHQNAMPYQRRSGGDSDRGGRDYHGHNHHHNRGGDRRSEQRRNDRR